MMWFIFAVLSAVFAALTSILAKVGIDGVNSNLATAIRTIVVVAKGHDNSLCGAVVNEVFMPLTGGNGGGIDDESPCL